MKYFGTDGIRGIAFKKLNSNLAYRVGQAIGFHVKPNRIVIGCDTRESSNLLSYSVALGLINSGVNIIFLGIVSTPIVSKYSKDNNIPGIMITASHNPYYDNGIKLFINGYKSCEEVELKIEDFVDHGTLYYEEKLGSFTLEDNPFCDYLKLYNQFDLSNTMLRIGYDSANGANYKISNIVFHKFFLEAFQINNAPNGKNINENCGSTHTNAITDFVRANSLDIGFSFDGDGDRLLVVDGSGKLYDGDVLIYIIAKYLKQQNKLTNNTVVLTKMSNPSIIKALNNININVSLVDVGDKNVFAELERGDFILGGENSGHIIMKDLLHTGDGLLVAIRLLQILKDANQSLAQLTSELELYPQKTVNIKGIDKSVLNKESVKLALEEAKTKLGDNSLLLVRPSGTEPLIRVTVSHESEKLMNDVITFLVDAIKNN
ncbi:phosphoglucosamine mutase [Acholeplasma sp. OttesenSCG-928-E16]|nr:phosphoglucosamine mutase [Acholeplasma sp. OttesenSCG-928-E16]